MPYAIRFAMPQDEIAWEDAVHGRISWQGGDLDDFIILRSDGSAIYNMAVVSDDIAMQISHVIRGDDHISNTPKQICLYRALGHEPPVFAHVPMILGPDGKKLSKRRFAAAVGDYQDKGILPSAMRNFLALLGWSPGGNEEIIAEPDMVSRFTLDHIQKKAAVFDVTKLEWMNGQYLSALPSADLLAPVQRQLEAMHVTLSGDLEKLIDAVKTRSRTVLDIAEQVAVRVDATRIVRDEKGAQLAAKLGERFAGNLRLAHEVLAGLSAESWDREMIESALRAVAESSGTKLGDIMQPIRVALTGGTVSEPVPELLAVVGRDESLRRIEASGASSLK